MTDIFDELYEKCKDQIKDPEPSPYYHVSEGIGKLLSFYRDYDVILKKLMLESEASLTYTDYLQDIEYLPITFMHTYFPIVCYIWAIHTRKNPNGTINLLAYSRNPVRDAQIGAPADLSMLYHVMEHLPKERIASYITDYAKAKRDDLERLDLVIEKNIFPNHSDWLKEVRKLWVYGVQPYSDLAVFDISEYQRHRNEFITDRIIRAAYDENLSELMQVKEDMQNLKKRNDLLHVMHRQMRPECELWFSGLDEIAQLGPFDVSKVSLKVISDAKVPLDNNIVLSKKHQATKIRLRYEGVKDATTLDLVGFRNDQYKVRDNECKLLLALAWWGKNQTSNYKEIQTLLSGATDDCVSRLNVMLRSIFNEKRVKFIEKAKGELKFNIEVEDVRELERA